MNPPKVDPITPATGKPSVWYPESDGKPVGETDFHITVIFYLRQALRHFFRHAEGLYVAANMFFYYEEGNRSAVTAPDTFVVKGVPKHDRRTYKLWEEKVAPCVTFEITSLSSKVEDLDTKKELYQLLGVQEYFLFDPLAEYLEPRFQGFELASGFYRPMAFAAGGVLRSRELGLIVRPDGPMLRLVDPQTGLALPTLGEALEKAEEAALRTQEEARRAQKEARRAQKEARRAQEEARRAEEEGRRAEEEARRAREEARRADAAEAEVALLRAELERLRGQTH